MKNLKLLMLIKTGMFFLLLVIILLPYAIKIHGIQKKYEPRRSLLNYSSTEGCTFALIGDSEFCSYYVNDDNDTIWKKFESITGNKCFPGALDGVTPSDLINATKYISYLMPANSVIFIDLIPTRFISSNKNKTNNYYEFDHLLNEQKYSVYYYKYLKYFDFDYFKYVQNMLNNIKTDRANSTNNYNRKWDTDGDFALNRYQKFKSTKILYEPAESVMFMKEINDILLSRNIRVVFVITPLNMKQIFAYSDKN